MDVARLDAVFSFQSVKRSSLYFLRVSFPNVLWMGFREPRAEILGAI